MKFISSPYESSKRNSDCVDIDLIVTEPNCWNGINLLWPSVLSDTAIICRPAQFNPIGVPFSNITSSPSSFNNASSSSNFIVNIDGGCVNNDNGISDKVGFPYPKLAFVVVRINGNLIVWEDVKVTSLSPAVNAELTPTAGLELAELPSVLVPSLLPNTVLKIVSNVDASSGVNVSSPSNPLTSVPAGVFILAETKVANDTLPNYCHPAGCVDFLSASLYSLRDCPTAIS